MAQPAGRTIVDQGITWSSYSANLKLTPQTTLFLDGHFRFASSDNRSVVMDPMQVLLRTHLEFNVKGQLTFSPLGYAYIHNYQYGKQPVTIPNHERRFYQQLAWSHNWGKTGIGHRIRTEERFIEDYDTDLNVLGFTNRQFRVRYRFIATRPIIKGRIVPGTFFTQTFYEGFISRGKKVTFEDIDQNRLFLGFGYQPVTGLYLSAGWFYQMLVKASGTKQENNAGLMIMAIHNLDLTSSQKD
ncbi:MAG: DUF2490 domain-containing protein [Cyclobacteriaceae bacterium]